MTKTDWRSIRAVKPALRLARKLRFRPLHRKETSVVLGVYGTDYGSWPVIDGSLGPDSVVYSFGIGEDISFDLEVIERYGCVVHAFDPTPRSIDWISLQDLPGGFVCHPYGLAGSSRVMRFAPPSKEGHVSYRAASAEKGIDLVDLQVHPLDWFMQELGHNHVDYLKMDIEGSEYEVISDLADKGITPGQICIEFHHRMHGHTDEETKRAVKQLQGMGYKIHYVSDTGREYGFHRHI